MKAFTEREIVPLRGSLESATWNALDPVQKIQALYGASLDLCREYLLYRGEDRTMIVTQDRARHDVMMICAKFAIETSREANRNEVLSNLADGLMQRNQEDGGQRTRAAPSRPRQRRKR